MKNATLTLSLVESELTRLHVIQKAIAEFTNNLETLEPDSGDMEPGGSFEKSLEDIARALNPNLSDEDVKECAQLPVLTCAARTAENITYLLLSVLKLAQGAPETENGVSADFLIEEAKQNKSGDGTDKEGFIKNFPWLIKAALDYLCSDSDVDYDKKPSSGTAVAMRMLAIIIHTLEIHGFKVVEPKDETETSDNGNIIMDGLPGLQS